jgi:hypothetical protein
VWNDLSTSFFILLRAYIIGEMQTVITSLAFSKHLIQYLHKCSGFGSFMGRWGKRFCLLSEKRGAGIMKETTQSSEKPLERHCQNKLASTARENGSDRPHERTRSSHPPQIRLKSQMTKMRTLQHGHLMQQNPSLHLVRKLKTQRELNSHNSHQKHAMT